MNTKGKKDKGRGGQNEVIALQMARKQALGLQEGDLTSRSMGSQGDDIITSPNALKSLLFKPWEVKRRKRIGLVRWIEQAIGSLGKKCIDVHPIVCFREDYGQWYCALKLSDLLDLLEQRIKNSQ